MNCTRTTARLAKTLAPPSATVGRGWRGARVPANRPWLRPALTLAVVAMLASAPAAAAPTAGAVIRVATRESVSVPIYAAWRTDAVATIVLFSGGGGGYGKIDDDGWPGSGNFLIRTGRRWASHPFNVVMVGRPSDGIDLALGNVRTGEQHAADNVAVFKAIKARSPLPLWLVGTSMGTISAAAATIGDTEELVAGLVLTSSIVGYKVPGSLPRQQLDKIRVPTLVVHHERDGCWACKPHEVGNLVNSLSAAPVRKAVFVSGGEGASGNPCEPEHFHGFIGMRDEVVDLIATWIQAPKP